MSDDPVVLTLEARHLLGENQRTLGDLLGVSRRTVQRWDHGHSDPSADNLQQLATIVHPKDPVLAAKLAAAGGTTLENLGVVAPPVAPPPLPPPAPPSPPAYLVDVVVCAAAEALNVPPPAVRPVLLAAFRKAREVGLHVEDVEAALTPAVESKPKPAKRR